MSDSDSSYSDYSSSDSESENVVSLDYAEVSPAKLAPTGAHSQPSSTAALSPHSAEFAAVSPSASAQVRSSSGDLEYADVSPAHQKPGGLEYADVSPAHTQPGGPEYMDVSPAHSAAEPNSAELQPVQSKRRRRKAAIEGVASEDGDQPQKDGEDLEKGQKDPNVGPDVAPLNRTLRKQKSGFGRKMLANIVGLPVDRQKKKVKVPDGYEVRHTAAGQAYLVKVGEEDRVADKEAYEEHLRKAAHISVCASRKTLGKTFGEGIYQYFDFMLFLCITNVILLAFGLVSLIPHFVFDGWVDYPNLEIHLNFYSWSYSPGIRPYWFWANVAAAFCWTFIFGPLLAKRINSRFDSIGYEDDEDVFDGMANDVIKDKKGFPKNPSHLIPGRLAVSYLLFIVVLLVSGAITVGFVMAQQYLVFNIAGGSFLISLLLSLMNALWKKICQALTILERHHTWTSFNNHHVLKFFLWKMLNIALVILAHWLVAAGLVTNIPIWAWIKDLAEASATSVGTNDAAAECDLKPIATQFVLILVIDMTIGNLADIMLPWLHMRYMACCKGKQIGASFDTGRPEFEVAEQYLNLIYRQFVMYIAFPFFPLIGLVALVTNLVDYLLDKAILLRICKTPPQLRGSMRHYLIFFLFVSGILSLALFPYGVGWVSFGGIGGFADRCANGTMLSVPFSASLGIANTTTAQV